MKWIRLIGTMQVGESSAVKEIAPKRVTLRSLLHQKWSCPQELFKGIYHALLIQLLNLKPFAGGAGRATQAREQRGGQPAERVSQGSARQAGGTQARRAGKAACQHSWSRRHTATQVCQGRQGCPRGKCWSTRHRPRKSCFSKILGSQTQGWGHRSAHTSWHFSQHSTQHRVTTRRLKS